MIHYLLEITLGPLDFPNRQRISRTLAVPASTTFHQLHEGIYEAFMWDDFHLYEFMVHDCVEWTEHSRQRSLSLLSIMEQPYDLGFGPPEKVSTGLTVGGVLEDGRYKGKVIEYKWDEFSHIITMKGKIGGEKMVLIEASCWRPGNDSNPQIHRFTEENRKLAARRLGMIKCGDDQEHPIVRNRPFPLPKCVGPDTMQDPESSIGDSTNDSDISGSEAGSEDVSDASEVSDASDASEVSDASELSEVDEVGEDTEDQILEVMQKMLDMQKQWQEDDWCDRVSVSQMQMIVDDLRDGLNSSRKRKRDKSTASSARVAKKSRTSYSSCRNALEEARRSRNES